MDAELWAARLAAAKRQHSLHHSQSQYDRMNVDGFEVEEDVRPDFSCPYCYEEYDIASLCSHLEDEHSYESKLAVCPVCSVKVGRDMLNHITTQHGHLFKIQRRRRLRRVAIPHGSTLSLLSRELREAHLQVLLGGGSYRSSNNSSSAVADSLLQSLVLNFPGSETEEIGKSAVSTIEDNSTKVKTASQQWKAWCWFIVSIAVYIGASSKVDVFRMIPAAQNIAGDNLPPPKRGLLRRHFTLVQST